MNTREQERAREALLELKRREERRSSVYEVDGVHPKQDAFFQDESPIVLASCSRRAGKSYGTARKIIKAMERFPRSISLYIVQAREQAKDIIWQPLIELDEKLNLGLRFKENTGEVVHPNKSKLVLRGASTKREVEKLRGLKHPLVIIDEAQSYTTSLLKYMVEDAVDACTMDYGRDAQICLIGTPNAACAGHFYNMIQSGDHPHYHWTAEDNPFLKDVQEFLARKRAQYGGETPTFLREFRGIWVKDKDALVFRLDDNINLVNDPEMPGTWEYTLGIDFGFNDPTAFVVLGHSRDRGEIMVVESFEETELTQGRIAAYVQELDDRYHFLSMVGDSQGYGKPLVEGLNKEYNLDVQPAKKRDKAAQIELMNSSLRSGVMKINYRKNEELVEQMRVLQWDPDQLENNKFAFLDNKFADHMADALVYAYRDIQVHDEGWEPTAPKHGTSEFWRAKEETWIQSREEKLEREHDELEWFDEIAFGEWS